MECTTQVCPLDSGMPVLAAEYERQEALERGMQPAAEQPAAVEEGAPLPSAPGTAAATALAILPPMPAGTELASPNAHVTCRCPNPDP